MNKSRKPFLVSWKDELRLMTNLKDRLISDGINASNTIIVTVSTDYSSVIGQYLRHQLTDAGEICEGFGIDVPYPDQNFDVNFVLDILHIFIRNHKAIDTKKILLVEAGVIRGGNYTKVVNIIKDDLQLENQILTLSMYENKGSIFKSDYVGEYYDNETQDLTFWWEMENNHWPS
jgi:hypothetical protein